MIEQVGDRALEVVPTVTVLRDNPDREVPDEYLMPVDEIDSREDLIGAAGYAITAYALHRQAAEQLMLQAVAAVRIARGASGETS